MMNDMLMGLILFGIYSTLVIGSVVIFNLSEQTQNHKHPRMQKSHPTDTLEIQKRAA